MISEKNDMIYAIDLNESKDDEEEKDEDLERFEREKEYDKRRSTTVMSTAGGYMPQEEAFNFLEQEEEGEEEEEEEDEENELFKRRSRRSRRESRIYLEETLPNIKSHMNILFYEFLHSLDILLSVTYFAPLVCIFWYCTWIFLDNYFVSERPVLSNWCTWCMSLFVLTLGYLFQNDLQEIYFGLGDLETGGGRVLARVAMRIAYIYLMSVAVIAEWRSIWNLIGLYFYSDWQSQLTLASLCTVYFVLTRDTKKLISPPFVLYIDNYENFFTSNIQLNLEKPIDYLSCILDFLFNEITQCFALVATWRGIEIAYSHHIYKIYPNDRVLTIVVSLIISHVIYLIIAIVQTFIYERASESSLLARLITEDFVHILMYISAVISWKFYWDSCDYYINLKHKKPISFYTSGHLAAFVMACVFKVSALLVGPGNSYLNGENIVLLSSYFEINYLTTIFQQQIEDQYEELLESVDRISEEDLEKSNLY